MWRRYIDFQFDLIIADCSHPDKNGGSDDKFVKIRLAYDILRDEHTRNEYHEFLDHPER
jgi:DnaJ-class molecular chaperone